MYFNLCKYIYTYLSLIYKYSGGLGKGEHTVAVAAVTSTGQVKGGWNRRSFWVVHESLIVDTHSRRLVARRRLDDNRQVGGGGGGAGGGGEGGGGGKREGGSWRGNESKDLQSSLAVEHNNIEIAESIGKGTMDVGGAGAGGEGEMCGFEHVVDGHHCYGVSVCWGWGGRERAR